MPGDPVNAYLGQGSKVTPEQQERIRAELGLDKGPVTQYINWLGRTLKEISGVLYSLESPLMN